MNELRTGSKWHAGELEVQHRAGVGEVSDRGIRDRMPDGFARFLAEQRMAAFGSVDAQGNTWASLRLGKTGFITAVDAFTVEIRGHELRGDPLLENLRANPGIGIVVLDPETRRRVRVNGTAEVLQDLIRVHAKQVYGNCPQYIQERVVEDGFEVRDSGDKISSGTDLNETQRRQVKKSDTFFIASAHPESGVDASHRGGNPGFVHIEGSRRLIIPDYSGNQMFNTLGNIYVNPSAGLVFPDFETGRTLQTTGKATIEWKTDRARFPGAERLIVYDIQRVIETQNDWLKEFEFRSYSPVNPSLAK